MNILLINHYAGLPQYGMEYRPYYMAREWVKMGHLVTIVGANYSHLRSTQPSCNEEAIEGIRYVWLNTPAYKGNGLSRVLNMLAFVKGLYCQWHKLIRGNNPDLVIASSTYPLDIYPARHIARKCGAKLVYEVHDLWPLSPRELGGMSKYHPFILIMQKAENDAYKSVDRVVSMLPNAKEHMLKHGLREDKFSYVPNGISADEWRIEDADGKEHGKVLNELKAQGEFLVLYAGAHGVANALPALVEAGCLVQEEKITIVLVGNGPEKEALEKKVSDDKISNVLFLPAVNKKEIPYVLSLADVLYIGLQKQPLFRFGISPNKMMDYMMASKPIISSIEAGNDLVSDAECGISVPAENPKEIAKALMQMKELSEVERVKLGGNGKVYVKKYHEYKVLAANFLEAIVL